MLSKSSGNGQIKTLMLPRASTAHLGRGVWVSDLTIRHLSSHLDTCSLETELALTPDLICCGQL